MHRATCLCGDVAWETDGELVFMHDCHCSRCRKAHGTPFATYVGVSADQLRIACGAERIVGWEPAPGARRNFCGRCGSVVPLPPSVDGQVFFPAGNLLEDPGVRRMFHIFVASKAPWFDIPDRLRRFDAFPPGVDAPVMPDRPPPVDPPDGIRGSCLCGGIAFAVTGEIILARNCHCSRCRRARSAACATNMVTSHEGVRFTRGEDLLSSYKVPEAIFFTQTFCRTCGSAMPRIDPGRGIAVIPMGALDDAPGVTPREHIFVGSKAPWFEITDALPQHEERPPKT